MLFSSRRIWLILFLFIRHRTHFYCVYYFALALWLERLLFISFRFVSFLSFHFIWLLFLFLLFLAGRHLAFQSLAESCLLAAGAAHWDEFCEAFAVVLIVSTLWKCQLSVFLGGWGMKGESLIVQHSTDLPLVSPLTLFPLSVFVSSSFAYSFDFNCKFEERSKVGNIYFPTQL